MVWPSLWSLTNVYLCPDSSSQIQTRVSKCVLDIYKTELLIFPLNQLHPILLNETLSFTLSFKPHKPKSLQFTAELSHSHLTFHQELFLTLLSKYTTLVPAITITHLGYDNNFLNGFPFRCPSLLKSSLMRHSNNVSS